MTRPLYRHRHRQRPSPQRSDRIRSRLEARRSPLHQTEFTRWKGSWLSASVSLGASLSTTSSGSAMTIRTTRGSPRPTSLTQSCSRSGASSRCVPHPVRSVLNHARLTHATPRHALSQASGASSSSGSTPSVAPKAASKGSRRASDLSTLSTLLTTVVDTLAPSDFSRHLPSRR